MKKKSSKLAKLERNRFSVFCPELDTCYVCGSNYQMTKHEIFEGRNRINSMKYGFVLPMCYKCHSELQESKAFNDFWKKKSQRYFEKHFGTREDFISIFRRNYL
jgi:hypothetical protein